MRIELKQQVLQEHIARNNLSQNGFAMKAQISGPYLAQILSGRRSPSGRVREKLMAASGLDFDALFTIKSAQLGDNQDRQGNEIYA